MPQDPGTSPEFNTRKKVDESWKDAVKKEAEPSSHTGTDDAIPESTFSYFVSSVGMQALIALGEIANPVSGQKKVELLQAQYLTDTLVMLGEKTKGNLSPSEEKVLRELLYQLQMKFVEKSRHAGESQS